MSTRFKQNLPMALTYLRVAAAPLILAILLSGWVWEGWLAAVIFILASLTDWLDGMLARKFKVESTMGQLMDPIADKILVLGAIIMLLAMGRVDPIMVFLFLARDIFIGGIRSVAASRNQIIAAKPFGKWKTAFQMTAIPCLLIYEPLWGLPLANIGYYGLWVSVGLSIISGVEYAVGFYKGAPKKGA
jgi:CDP-diacylglycerol--glycerol-3-phosphate 3-phosphatidyltransferase